MNNYLNPAPQPPVGATFYPGGDDDFYVPELVSPSPQRVMPEVPENMQHNLANLEHQSQGQGRYGGQFPPRQQSRGAFASPPPQSQYQQPPPAHRQSSHGSFSQSPYDSNQSWRHEPMVQPNFSPFPALQNPPPNVPPTAEQKQASLEAARMPVLASSDPSNQLEWAQDTLAYIEEEMQNEQRTNGQPVARLSQLQQLLKDDAVKVVNFLADQRHPQALVLRGIWLEFGKFDHPVDKRQAWQCYKTAVESASELAANDAAKKWGGRAQYRIGMQFENSKEIASAVKYYQMGVECGDSAACYRMGMMVLLGQHGQAQDLQHGLQLIVTAADNADENAPQGAYVLGMLQAHELPQVSLPPEVLPQDLGNARMNIERAAFLGFAKAQTKMGTAYELCELGCDFDPALSLHYNNLAARQGEPEAEMAISKWFLAGHEGVFDKDEAMAFQYAQRAAQDGLPTAQFAIGYFHEIGIYVPVNLRVAKEWYKMASANGNSDAAGRVDGISRSKTLSRKDHERIAVSKIKNSRQQGSTETAPRVPSMQAVIDMPDPSNLGGPNGAAYPVGRDLDRPRPASNMSTPNVRPRSAFGINPNLRPSSAAPGEPRPDQGGRPALVAPGRSYPADGRTASGSDFAYPASAAPGQPPPDRRPSPQPPGKVDIGYLAPIDSGGGGGRPPRSSSGPHSPLPPSGQGLGSSRPASGGAPNRRSSASQPPDPAAPATSRPGGPADAKAQGATPKPTTAARPPGKGPKTFEEMGVPAGKGKDDCIMM